MKLSILDQSVIRAGGNAKEALDETLDLAQYAETLGYHRFWLSEHHATYSLAGMAPEILISHIAAQTQKIRIGAGGIMLPHYSTFKVAETFSLLATLYPDRIDLGIGRAAGSDLKTAKALANDGIPKFDRFPEQVAELQQILLNEKSEPFITSRPKQAPPIWMLGTGAGSARLAAQYGLPYNFAQFIAGRASNNLFDLYREGFQPSVLGARPYSIVCVNVVCAETEEEAMRLAKSYDLFMVQRRQGQDKNRISSVETAEAYSYSNHDLAIMEQNKRMNIAGTPEQVKTQLKQLAVDYGLDEIMVVSGIYDFSARKYSHQLLAHVMELSS